jgi:hypothetical protein
MLLRAIARLIQMIFYLQRVLPFYVNNNLGGIKKIVHSSLYLHKLPIPLASALVKAKPSCLSGIELSRLD